MTDPSAFRNSLAELSPERFAAFVEAVWTTRGREISRAGLRLTVTDEDGGSVLYARSAGDDDPVPGDVDVVVSATPIEREVDGDWIGPADLLQLMRFAVPDAERDRLFTEHLDIDRNGPSLDETQSEQDTVGADYAGAGASPTSSAASAIGGGSDGDPTPDTETGADGARRRPGRRSVLLAGGAFVAGLVTAAAGGLGPFGSAGGAPREPVATPTPEPEPEVAVPGLSRSGVADPPVLARAHLDRLEATSFTLSSTRTVHADVGTLLSSLRLLARVDETRQFLAEIGTAGPGGRDVFGEPPTQATLYSDGEFQYRRLSSGGETTYDAVPLGAGVNGWFYWTNIFPFGSLFYTSDEYYRDLFDSVPVSLTSRAGDEEPPYHLHATDVTVPNPNPQVFAGVDDGSPVGNLTLLASVTGAGLVDSLRLSFDGQRFSDPAMVQVSADYRVTGETTVDRPAWTERVDSS